MARLLPILDTNLLHTPPTSDTSMGITMVFQVFQSSCWYFYGYNYGYNYGTSSLMLGLWYGVPRSLGPVNSIHWVLHFQPVYLEQPGQAKKLTG